MNLLTKIAVGCLGLAAVVALTPTGFLPPRERPSPRPVPAITLDDPGDRAAIKFMALWASAVSRESAAFSKRLANNPQSKEFAGPAPAAAAWRDISEEVLTASQRGLAAKINAIQDDPDGWSKAAQYQAEASRGWERVAQELSALVGEE